MQEKLSEESLTPAQSDVLMKYCTAADIIKEVLSIIIQECVVGADIADLCRRGDSLIEERCTKVYTKKEKGEKIRKGVAVPTSISPNEFCSNFSPSKSESFALKANDLVKVSMGCHIDGFISVAAHTFVVGCQEITGRKADVLRAAWLAAGAALKTINVGVSSSEVAQVMNKTVEHFKCKMVCGISSHQLKQHVVDGIQAIRHRETTDDKTEPFTFGVHEVYGMDIIVSTGEGKLKESDFKTRIYQRNVEENYSLKTPLARQFMREVQTRFPAMPFVMHAFENEKLCRVGISECMRHSLLQPYPVMMEKTNEYIAQFKYTVLLLPGGIKKITALPLDQDASIKSEYRIEDDKLQTLIDTPLKTKKKKKPASASTSATPAATENFS